MSKPEHRIVVDGREHDPNRDRVSAKIICTVPGCVYGTIAGAPAASIDRLLWLIADEHPRMTP